MCVSFLYLMHKIDRSDSPSVYQEQIRTEESSQVHGVECVVTSMAAVSQVRKFTRTKFMDKSGFECCSSRATCYHFLHKKKMYFHFCSCARVKTHPAFLHTEESNHKLQFTILSLWLLPLQVLPDPVPLFAPTSPLTFHLGCLFLCFFLSRGLLLGGICQQKNALTTPSCQLHSSLAFLPPASPFFSPSGGGTKRPFRSVWLLISGTSSGGGEGLAAGRRQNMELCFPLPHLHFRPISAL